MSNFRVSQPIPPTHIVEKCEYKMHFNEPGTGRVGTITISGLLGSDMESAARSLFLLLVESGWMPNPAMMREVRRLETTGFHAEGAKLPGA
jgi:hypothetical protein